MSCIELLDILSKPWANVQNIMKIMNGGRDSAIKMRDTIHIGDSQKWKRSSNRKNNRCSYAISYGKVES